MLEDEPRPRNPVVHLTPQQVANDLERRPRAWVRSVACCHDSGSGSTSARITVGVRSSCARPHPSGRMSCAASVEQAAVEQRPARQRGAEPIDGRRQQQAYQRDGCRKRPRARVEVSGVPSSSREVDSDTISASRPRRVTVSVCTTMPASTKRERRRPAALEDRGDDQQRAERAHRQHPPPQHEEQQEEDQDQGRRDQHGDGAAAQDCGDRVPAGCRRSPETAPIRSAPDPATPAHAATVASAGGGRRRRGCPAAGRGRPAGPSIGPPSTRLHAMSVSGQRRRTSGSSAM